MSSTSTIKLITCIERTKKFRKIGLIPPTSENEVLSSLIISIASLLNEERGCVKAQKRNHKFLSF